VLIVKNMMELKKMKNEDKGKLLLEKNDKWQVKYEYSNVNFPQEPCFHTCLEANTLQEVKEEVLCLLNEIEKYINADVEAIGKVKQCDRDACTFQLRNIIQSNVDGKVLTFNYTLCGYDLERCIIDSLINNRNVKVIGKKEGDLFCLTGIHFV